MHSICVAHCVLLISLFTRAFYFLGSVLLLALVFPPFPVFLLTTAHLKWPIFQYLGAEPLFSYGVFIITVSTRSNVIWLGSEST